MDLLSNFMQSSMQTPNETVQLFFNGNSEKVIEQSKDKDIVFKNYIIRQNQNLLKDNKKLERERVDIEHKMEEVEEENDSIEKRFQNTKVYLKNFRFINECHEKIAKQFDKFSKELHTNKLIKEFRLFLGTFSLFIILCSVFGFTQWWVMIPLHAGYAYGFHEFFVPDLKSIEQKRKHVLDFRKEQEKEIKDLTKTMDIVSEFIDNAL